MATTQAESGAARPPQAGMPDVEDALFWRLHAKCAPYSLLTPEKFYNLYAAIQYVCDRQIPGDIIECGVWKGGAVLLVADVLASRKMLDYDIFLYDTFAGFVERSASDVNYAGVEIGKVKHKFFLDETRANVALSDYPVDKIHFVPGDVRETVQGDKHEQIALLRLDTDTYASTLHELTALYDKIVSGGVLIVDDYGYSRGCREAVESFFETRPKLLLQRPNSGARTGIKI